MQQHDVLVIGAGPGGSRASGLLAGRGYDVLVLEEHPTIGLPVHCSGFVTPRTLTEAEAPESMVLNAVKGAIVHTPGGKTLTLGGDRTRAYALDRCQLDRHVAQWAEERGARFQMGTRVASVVWTTSGVTIAAKRDGRPETHYGRMVIGADGVRSIVASAMGREAGEQVWCIGADARLAGHPKDMVRVYVGNETAPGWFGWSIPLGGNRVRLGIGGVMRSGAMKPRRLLDALYQTFAAQFRGVEVQSWGGGMIPLYRPVRTYGNRALLVGDAALQAKPTSGGGIYTSLAAARHAAATADAALRDDELGFTAMQSYEESWRAELGEELDRGVDIREAYLRLNDRELDRLVEIFRTPLLRPVINRYGDIDYPSRMFGHLLTLMPLLKPVLSLPDVLPSRWGRFVDPRRWASSASR